MKERRRVERWWSGDRYEYGDVVGKRREGQDLDLLVIV